MILIDLQKFKLSINFSKQPLCKRNILINYRHPDDNKKSYSINAYEVLLKEIPVNEPDGEILSIMSQMTIFLFRLL